MLWSPLKSTLKIFKACQTRLYKIDVKPENSNSISTHKNKIANSSGNFMYKTVVI